MDSDEFVVLSEEYQLQNLLEDIIPEDAPEPIDPEATWPKKAEIYWHWYSPDPEMNTTKLNSYLSVQLFYRQNKAGTKYTLRKRVWDSRYKGGRITEFVQQVDQPLLNNHRLTYGAGLPSVGNWTYKRVINGVESNLATATAEGNLAPQCQDAPTPATVVEIMPPNLDLDPSQDFTYVIRYPEALGLTSDYTPEGRIILAAVNIKDAVTNQVYSRLVSNIEPGQEFQKVRSFGGDSIPYGSVVYAEPEIFEASGDASLKDSDEVDYRLAHTETGIGDGLPASDADSFMTVAQVSVGAAPAPRRFKSTGKLYGQQVLPASKCAHHHTPVTGSMNREVDMISGRSKYSATDLSLSTVGLPIVISRYYNPARSDRLPTRGWQYSYERKLSVYGDNASITYQNPDGTSERFEFVGGNRWEASPKSSMAGAFIEQTSATDFRVTYKSKTKEIFSRPLNGYPNEALLKAEIDNNGNTNTYTWNATGTQLVHITDPNGRQVTFVWKAELLPQSITDWTGRTIQYTYQNRPSGALLLIRVVNADGEPVRYQYARDFRRSQANPNGELYQIVATLTPSGIQDRIQSSSARGALGVFGASITSQGTYTKLTQTGIPGQPLQTVKFDISSVGGSTQSYTAILNEFVHPVSITNPLGGQSSLSYTPNCEVSEYINAKGQQYEYTWDEAGNPLSMKDPRGITTTFTWDADSNLTEVVRPNNERYQFTYDANSNLKTVIDPENQTTTFNYNAQGKMSERINNLGKVWNYSYDANGALEEILMPRDNPATGSRARWVYANDNLGRRTSAQDPRGNLWRYTYDDEDRVTEITYPDNTKSRFTFNNEGLLTVAKDQANVHTSFVYNNALQLKTTVESSNQGSTRRETNYVYDGFGRLSTLRDAKNQATTYTYDRLNRPLTINYPGSITETFTYDEIGNVLKAKKGDGTDITYTYDTANRLTKIEHPSLSPAITYAYNDNNRRTSMVDVTGTTSWTYNKKGQPLTVAAPSTGTLTYTYDTIGRLKTITDPQNLVTTYNYTDRNLMASVNHDSQTISYAYDLAGNLTGKTLPNGVLCNLDYDQLNRLTRLQYAQGMNAPFFSEDYTLDNVGNLKRNISVTTSGTNVLRYTYDKLYHLTQVEEKVGSTFSIKESFAYDPQGSITNFNGTTFSNNNADQLTSAPPSTLGYDGNGNADEIQDGSGTRTMTFNYADLPTEIKQGANAIGTYLYNGDKQRVSRTAPGTFGLPETSRYLWTGSEVLKEYHDNGNVKASYILGVGREAIKSNDGSWRFYIPDRLGSTRFLTDSSGQVVNAYNYSAYGDVTVTLDTPPPGGGFITYYNPYLFTGQQFDAQEGNYYLRNRYYDPTFGRFLVRDPIRFQGGMNLYEYCGGNPVNFVDPFGHKPQIHMEAGPGNYAWLKLQYNGVRYRLRDEMPSVLRYSFTVTNLDTMGWSLSLTDETKYKGASLDSSGNPILDEFYLTNIDRPNQQPIYIPFGETRDFEVQIHFSDDPNSFIAQGTLNFFAKKDFEWQDLSYSRSRKPSSANWLYRLQPTHLRSEKSRGTTYTTSTPLPGELGEIRY